MSDRQYNSRTNTWEPKPRGTDAQRQAWLERGNSNWSPFSGFTPGVNGGPGSFGGGGDAFSNPMFPGQQSGPGSNPLDPFGVTQSPQGDPTVDLETAADPLNILAPQTQEVAADGRPNVPAPGGQAPAQPNTPAEPQMPDLFGTTSAPQDAQQSKTGLGKMADIMDPIWSITSPQYLEKKRQAQSQQLQIQQQALNLDQSRKKAALEDYQLQRNMQAIELGKRAARGDISALTQLRTSFPEHYEAAKPRLITSLRDNRVGLNDLATRLETASTPEDIENIKAHVRATDPDLAAHIENMPPEELKRNSFMFREMANDVQAEHIAQQKRTNALNGYTPITDDKGQARRQEVPLSNGATVSLPLMRDAAGNEVLDDRMFDKKGVQWASNAEVKELRTEFTKEWERGEMVQSAAENIKQTVHNWDKLGPTRGPTLIYSFIKGLDAESVVREAEVSMVQSERDVMSTFVGNVQRIKEGGQLTKPEAEIFQKQMEILARTQNMRLNEAMEQTLIQAAAYNIKDPKRVVRGFDPKNEDHARMWAEAQASAKDAIDTYRSNSMINAGPTDQAGNALVIDGQTSVSATPARTTGEAPPAPPERTDPQTGRTIFDYTAAQEKAVAERAANPKPTNPGDIIEFDLGGKIRGLPVSKNYLSSMTNVLQSVSQETGMNVTAVITSAGQEKGIYDKQGRLLNPDKHTGGPRHDVGPDGKSDTADLVLKVNGKVVHPSQEPQIYQTLFKHAAAAGHQGMGHYSWGVHIGGGSKAFWGPTKSRTSADPFFKAGAVQGYDGDMTDRTAISQLPPQRPGAAQQAAAAPLQQQPQQGGAVTDQYVSALSMAESSNRNIDHTGDPNSGPSGYFGFADGTWRETTGLPGRAMDYPYEVQAQAARQLSEKLADDLQKNGHEVTPGNIYALHFLGASGGNRLLNAPENEAATRHASKAAVKNNRTIFYRDNGKPRTVAEVKAVLAKKVTPGDDEPPRGPGPGPRPDPRNQAPAGNNPLAPLQQAQAAQTGGPSSNLGQGATMDQLRQMQPPAQPPAPQSPYAGAVYGGIGVPPQSEIDRLEARNTQTAQLEEQFGANRFAAIEHGIRQGLTLGWADEMGLVPKEDYEILRKAYPATTALSEILGGVVSGGPVGKGVGMAANSVKGLWGKAIAALGIGAEGAVTGAGFAEEGEKGEGAVIGALGAAGILGVTKAAASGWSKLRAFKGGDLDAAIDLVVKANQGDEIAKQQVLNAGLSTNDIKDAALQVQGKKMVDAGAGAVKDVDPGSVSAGVRRAEDLIATPKRDPLQTGEQVAGAIQQVADTHKANASKIYGAISGEVIPPSEQGADFFIQNIEHALKERGMAPLLGDDPGVHSALNVINQNIDTVIGPNGFDFAKFDEIRSAVGSKANALRVAGDTHQANKVMAVRDVYDDIVLDGVDDILMSNNQTIGANVNTARAEWRAYKKLTDERAKNYVDRTIANMASDNRTPEQVTNLLFGSQNIGAKDTSRAVAAKLKGVVGADSPAWKAVQGEALGRIFYDKATGDLLPRDGVVSNLKYFLGGQGKEVGKELFNKSQREALAAIGSQITKRSPRERNAAFRNLAASLGVNLTATNTMGPFMGPAVAESVTGQTPLRGLRELRIILFNASQHAGTPLGDLSEELVKVGVNYGGVGIGAFTAGRAAGAAANYGGPASTGPVTYTDTGPSSDITFLE